MATSRLKYSEWLRGILSSMATLSDPGFWTCLEGALFCGAGIGAVIGCAVATMGAGFVACLAAVFGVSSFGIFAAIASGTGVIWGWEAFKVHPIRWKNGDQQT